jgi:hypothetical protein
MRYSYMFSAYVDSARAFVSHTYSQTIVLMVFEIIFQYVPFSTDNDGNGGGNGGGVSKGGD